MVFGGKKEYAGTRTMSHHVTVSLLFLWERNRRFNVNFSGKPKRSWGDDEQTTWVWLSNGRVTTSLDLDLARSTRQHSCGVQSEKTNNKNGPVVCTTANNHARHCQTDVLNFIMRSDEPTTARTKPYSSIEISGLALVMEIGTKSVPSSFQIFSVCLILLKEFVDVC